MEQFLIILAWMQVPVALAYLYVMWETLWKKKKRNSPVLDYFLVAGVFELLAVIFSYVIFWLYVSMRAAERILN